jgi:hypothetical protein
MIIKDGIEIQLILTLTDITKLYNYYFNFSTSSLLILQLIFLINEIVLSFIIKIIDVFEQHLELKQLHLTFSTDKIFSSFGMSKPLTLTKLIILIIIFSLI